jgi:phenylpyruvate tautomerase PptA (4-oxalocrotonate tautomerase family)
MPTYTCWSEAGAISSEARGRIATALTEIHHQVADAPRYLVQVLFADVPAGSQFLAGRPVPERYVWVRADIRAGRTEELKRELLLRIVREVSEILDLAPEQVRVYICEIPGPNIAEYGQIMPHPGQEEAWFAALPEELRSGWPGSASPPVRCCRRFGPAEASRPPAVQVSGRSPTTKMVSLATWSGRAPAQASARPTLANAWRACTAMSPGPTRLPSPSSATCPATNTIALPLATTTWV